MKKLILSIVLFTSSMFANMYTLNPITITKNVTCFIGDFHPPTKSNKGFVSNVCMIDMGESVVVIEAGPTYNFAKQLHEYINKNVNKKVSHVIVTNFHDDRYTGASYYKEKNIPIVAHKSIVKELKDNPDKFNRIPKITTAQEYKNSKVVDADIFTDDKYIIKGKSLNIEVLKLSVGSNSASDIAVYSPKDDFIFVGNTVFNGRMLKYGQYSNIDNWIEALEKLKKMNVKYVLGGHGSQYDKNSYKHNLGYLRLLKNNVPKMYEDDMEVDEIKKALDVSKYSNTNHFDGLSSGNISTYFNQLEWAE